MEPLKFEQTGAIDSELELRGSYFNKNSLTLELAGDCAGGTRWESIDIEIDRERAGLLVDYLVKWLEEQGASQSSADDNQHT